MLSFNPRSASFRADPYPVYHTLRTQDPIHYRPEHNDWVLTRYADLTTLLKDNRIDLHEGETPAQMNPSITQQTQSSDDFLSLREKSQALRSQWIIVTNPPIHTRLHKILRSAFLPKQVDQLQSYIQTLADRFIDNALPANTLDIVRDYASPLIINTISELLGVPDQDRPKLAQLAYELSNSIDLNTDDITFEKGQFALLGLTHYFSQRITDLRQHPTDESHLLNSLIQAQIAGQLSEDEVLANSVFLFFTGQGAPQHIIGNGLFTLLQHPKQLHLLQTKPKHMHTALDECLRYDCPGQYIVRHALKNIDINGKTIKKGQKIIFVIGAANRDPAQFSAPDNFDICRTPNRYLTFGYGMRYCMGVHVAKRVAHIGLETLIRRLPYITLKSQRPEWESSYRTHGLKALPVNF
jgi:cytochrome P450